MSDQEITSPDHQGDVGKEEIRHRSKDVLVRISYMWMAFISLWLGGLGTPLVIQGVSTMEANSEANRTLTDTLATLRDFIAVVTPSWTIYEEPNSGGGVNRYLQSQIVAPNSYTHLIATGWKPQPNGDYMVKTSVILVAGEASVKSYSSWIGTTTPVVDADGKMTFRFSEHNFAPDGVFIDGAQYYAEYRANLESPEGRIRRSFVIRMGWYTYNE